MPQRIFIIDYGVGNLHSVFRKVSQLNVDVQVTDDPKVLHTADKIILPGIGHFRVAMQHISSCNLLDELNELVIVQKKPVLGICLGMQIMASNSDEAPGTVGLGWFSGKVTKFSVPDNSRFKIPFIGWAPVDIQKPGYLFRNIPSGTEFYFSHSFHYSPENMNVAVSTTNYGYDFVSAVVYNNIYGVQFHPEKSYEMGKTLIQNFIAL